MALRHHAPEVAPPHRISPQDHLPDSGDGLAQAEPDIRHSSSFGSLNTTQTSQDAGVLTSQDAAEKLTFRALVAKQLAQSKEDQLVMARKREELSTFKLRARLQDMQEEIWRLQREVVDREHDLQHKDEYIEELKMEIKGLKFQMGALRSKREGGDEKGARNFQDLKDYYDRRCAQLKGKYEKAWENTKKKHDVMAYKVTQIRSSHTLLYSECRSNFNSLMEIISTGLSTLTDKVLDIDMAWGGTDEQVTFLEGFMQQTVGAYNHLVGVTPFVKDSEGYLDPDPPSPEPDEDKVEKDADENGDDAAADDTADDRTQEGASDDSAASTQPAKQARSKGTVLVRINQLIEFHRDFVRRLQWYGTRVEDAHLDSEHHRHALEIKEMEHRQDFLRQEIDRLKQRLQEQQIHIETQVVEKESDDIAEIKKQAKTQEAWMRVKWKQLEQEKWQLKQQLEKLQCSDEEVAHASDPVAEGVALDPEGAHQPRGVNLSRRPSLDNACVLQNVCEICSRQLRHDEMPQISLQASHPGSHRSSRDGSCNVSMISLDALAADPCGSQPRGVSPRAMPHMPENNFLRGVGNSPRDRKGHTAHGRAAEGPRAASASAVTLRLDGSAVPSPAASPDCSPRGPALRVSPRREGGAWPRPDTHTVSPSNGRLSPAVWPFADNGARLRSGEQAGPGVGAGPPPGGDSPRVQPSPRSRPWSRPEGVPPEEGVPRLRLDASRGEGLPREASPRLQLKSTATPPPSGAGLQSSGPRSEGAAALPQDGPGQWAGDDAAAHAQLPDGGHGTQSEERVVQQRSRVGPAGQSEGSPGLRVKAGPGQRTGVGAGLRLKAGPGQHPEDADGVRTKGAGRRSVDGPGRHSQGSASAQDGGQHSKHHDGQRLKGRRRSVSSAGQRSDGAGPQSQGAAAQQSQGGAGQQSQGGAGQQSQVGAGQQSQGGAGQQSQGGAGQQSQGGAGQQSQGGAGQQSQGGAGLQFQGGASLQSQGGAGQQSQRAAGQQSQGGAGQQSQGGAGQQSQRAAGQQSQGGAEQQSQRAAGQQSQGGGGQQSQGGASLQSQGGAEQQSQGGAGQQSQGGAGLQCQGGALQKPHDVVQQSVDRSEQRAVGGVEQQFQPGGVGQPSQGVAGPQSLGSPVCQYSEGSDGQHLQQGRSREHSGNIGQQSEESAGLQLKGSTGQWCESRGDHFPAVSGQQDGDADQQMSVAQRGRRGSAQWSEGSARQMWGSGQWLEGSGRLKSESPQLQREGSTGLQPAEKPPPHSESGSVLQLDSESGQCTEKGIRLTPKGSPPQGNSPTCSPPKGSFGTLQSDGFSAPTQEQSGSPVLFQTPSPPADASSWSDVNGWYPSPDSSHRRAPRRSSLGLPQSTSPVPLRDGGSSARPTTSGSPRKPSLHDGRRGGRLGVQPGSGQRRSRSQGCVSAVHDDQFSEESAAANDSGDHSPQQPSDRRRRNDSTKGIGHSPADAQKMAKKRRESLAGQEAPQKVLLRTTAVTADWEASQSARVQAAPQMPPLRSAEAKGQKADPRYARRQSLPAEPPGLSAVVMSTDGIVATNSMRAWGSIPRLPTPNKRLSTPATHDRPEPPPGPLDGGIIVRHLSSGSLSKEASTDLHDDPAYGPGVGRQEPAGPAKKPRPPLASLRTPRWQGSS